MAEGLLVAVGLALIAFVTRDAFRTVVHPEGRGTLSRVIQRALRRASAPVARRHGKPVTVAAPLGVMLTIGGWMAGAIAGWGALYWAALPDGITDTVEGSTAIGALDALYLSLTTVTTLGYGDLVATGDWLRLMAPLQALFGFALLSASISWVLSIQPALARLRSFAAHLSSIEDPPGDGDPPVEALPAPTLAALLRGLAERVGTTESDLGHFPTAYWFEPSQEHLSLAQTLPRAARLAADAAHHDDRQVRQAGAQARLAIERLAALLGSQFLRMPGAPADEVLRAYSAQRTHGDAGGGA